MQSLPDFILKAIESRNTSLGDNGIFKGDTVSLTRSLLSGRRSQVIKSVEDRIGYIPTIDEAKTRLSRLIAKAIETEKPIRDQLETLCEATVNETLGIPQETILLSCELVKEIEPYGSMRITPDFDAQPPRTSKTDLRSEIMKRRVIDSMVQGISYLLMTATYDSDKLMEWSQELPEIYSDIIALNDFLLFSEEEEITERNPMLGAYVETEIGEDGEKTVINSQGLTYPLLLQETYRGFFELFATHGLPNEMEDAVFITKRADFTVAEAWDLRIGVALWQEIDKRLDDNVEPTVYPYLFSTIAELDCSHFNDFINDAMTGNSKVDEFLSSIVHEIEHDREYQLFKKDIERFNMEKCLITDEDNEDDGIID